MVCFSESIYFYCVLTSLELGWEFHYFIICLTEWFKGLGIGLYLADLFLRAYFIKDAKIQLFT
jgi:hypothetical protein